MCIRDRSSLAPRSPDGGPRNGLESGPHSSRGGRSAPSFAEIPNAKSGDWLLERLKGSVRNVSLVVLRRA
eukprot:6997153-Alexandrium_andersonii.AAC.1